MCVDNALATVFSGPLSSVSVTKGIFTVSVDGERVAFSRRPAARRRQNRAPRFRSICVSPPSVGALKS
jgi:predicted transcriptional regulator